jgi:VIT1/CCC1 family predicted Fe2+/Mn2+ transporter
MTPHATESTQEIPSLEPWLIVCLGAFVPMTAAFMLPNLVPYLFCLASALLVASGAMLVRQERRKRR